MDNYDLHRPHKVDNEAEQRITSIIIEHWKNVRGIKNIPSQEDLDPNTLETILDNCFLVATSELINSGEHNYIYIGQNILDAYGSNDTAPNENNNISPLSHKNKFEKVIKTQKPIIDEGEFINKNGQVVKYRQCLVPLGNDGETVESILGGMRFKIF